VSRKEIQQLAACQLAAEHHRAARISAMGVKSILSNIQTDRDNL
jgi:hypothetical protein